MRSRISKMQEKSRKVSTAFFKSDSFNFILFIVKKKDAMDPVALERAINMYHPRQANGAFPIWARLGGYPFIRYCRAPIQPLAKEIGVGPTIFLLTTKAVAMFMTILTILHMPLYTALGKGSNYNDLGSGDTPFFAGLMSLQMFPQRLFI